MGKYNLEGISLFAFAIIWGKEKIAYYHYILKF